MIRATIVARRGDQAPYSSLLTCLRSITEGFSCPESRSIRRAGSARHEPSYKLTEQAGATDLC